jgi:hypothetical protein
MTDIKLVPFTYKYNFLFPRQQDVDRNQLHIFNTSSYSMTLPTEADNISITIKKILNIPNSSRDLIITDGSAHVGGNTLSFSKHFYKVNAIEIDKEMYDALVHNIKEVYKRWNVTYYLGDCIKIIHEIKHDVVFLDPPWGGPSYKDFTNLHLFLGSEDIFDLVLDWYNKKLAKLFCIKCPFNFDFGSFKTHFPNIYIQKNKNWYVIYISLQVIDQNISNLDI